MLFGKRIHWLFAVLFVVAVSVSVTSMLFLYDAAMQEQRSRLTDIARSQARLMESMAAHGLEHERDNTPENVFSSVLHQVREARSEPYGFAKTGEFTLARLGGDSMIFLLGHWHDTIVSPGAVSLSSELAEPMRLALTSAAGGTVIGLDYRGEVVLAAYEPVDVLNLGIVAKIDLKEIRKPFVDAGFLSALSALLLVVAGAGLLWRIAGPMIKSLKETTERLTATQQIAHLGYLDWDVKAGLITWSEEALSIYGLESHRNPMTLAETVATTHPEDLDYVNKAFEAVLAAKDDYESGYRIIRPDNAIRFILAQGKMQRGEDGSPVRMLWTILDITERKKAEQTINDSRQLLQNIADNLPAMISYVDKDGKYVFANKEYRARFGLSHGEIIGRSLQEVLGEEGYNVVRSSIETALSGTPVTYNGELPLKESMPLPFEASYLPHVEEDGTVSGLIVMVKDITDQLAADQQRSHMEKQLYQSEKMASIGQLAAGVAHEINNPVGYVSSNLNTMQKYLRTIEQFVRHIDNPDAANQESVCEVITDFGDAIVESLDGMDRVTRIVSDLKGFSRSDSNETQSVDINDGIESTLNIVWNQLKYTCTIDKNLGDLPHVECVAGQINQVIMILLINAGQAIGKSDGHIVIKTWHEPENVYISVSDNGVGIPIENLKRIFDPFFTTKDVGQGTGLGLSLAFGIIHKHGGRIDVESEAGHGSTFTITLPVRAASLCEKNDSPDCNTVELMDRKHEHRGA